MAVLGLGPRLWFVSGKMGLPNLAVAGLPGQLHSTPTFPFLDKEVKSAVVPRDPAPGKVRHLTPRLAQMARVFAVANQKGGVAKTTTVQTLGAALAELGERVLLVDLDPQACLTFAVGLEPDTLSPTLHDILLGRAKS